MCASDLESMVDVASYFPVLVAIMLWYALQLCHKVHVVAYIVQKVPIAGIGKFAGWHLCLCGELLFEPSIYVECWLNYGFWLLGNFSL